MRLLRARKGRGPDKATNKQSGGTLVESDSRFYLNERNYFCFDSSRVEEAKRTLDATNARVWLCTGTIVLRLSHKMYPRCQYVLRGRRIQYQWAAVCKIRVVQTCMKDRVHDTRGNHKLRPVQLLNGGSADFHR